jgi:hypothetical protein
MKGTLVSSQLMIMLKNVIIRDIKSEICQYLAAPGHCAGGSTLPATFVTATSRTRHTGMPLGAFRVPYVAYPLHHEASEQYRTQHTQDQL